MNTIEVSRKNFSKIKIFRINTGLGHSQTIVIYAPASTPLCLFSFLSLPLCTSDNNYAEISVRKKMHLAGRILN